MHCILASQKKKKKGKREFHEGCNAWESKIFTFNIEANYTFKMNGWFIFLSKSKILDSNLFLQSFPKIFLLWSATTSFYESPAWQRFVISSSSDILIMVFIFWQRSREPVLWTPGWLSPNWAPHCCLHCYQSDWLTQAHVLHVTFFDAGDKLRREMRTWSGPLGLKIYVQELWAYQWSRWLASLYTLRTEISHCLCSSKSYIWGNEIVTTSYVPSDRIFPIYLFVPCFQDFMLLLQEVVLGARVLFKFMELFVSKLNPQS